MDIELDDEDIAYYKKLGYRREGSIFEVQVGKQRS